MSNTLHRRRRPMTHAMPFSVSRSRRGCGRFSSWRITIGCSGAEGSFSSCGSDEYDVQIFSISSRGGFLSSGKSNSREIHAVWPSTTGTRVQVEDTTAYCAFSIFPSFTVPRIFRHSFSDFSSSPPINGTMLSIISKDGTPGYPAPDVACNVVTIILFTGYPA